MRVEQVSWSLIWRAPESGSVRERESERARERESERLRGVSPADLTHVHHHVSCTPLFR